MAFISEKSVSPYRVLTTVKSWFVDSNWFTCINNNITKRHTKSEQYKGSWKANETKLKDASGSRNAKCGWVSQRRPRQGHWSPAPDTVHSLLWHASIQWQTRQVWNWPATDYSNESIAHSDHSIYSNIYLKISKNTVLSVYGEMWSVTLLLLYYFDYRVESVTPYMLPTDRPLSLCQAAEEYSARNNRLRVHNDEKGNVSLIAWANKCVQLECCLSLFMYNHVWTVLEGLNSNTA